MLICVIYDQCVLQERGGCVKELTLNDGVHCGVDTLHSLCSMVGHSEEVLLTINTGCVLEPPSITTTTPQRTVSRPDGNGLVVMMS